MLRSAMLLSKAGSRLGIFQVSSMYYSSLTLKYLSKHLEESRNLTLSKGDKRSSVALKNAFKLTSKTFKMKTINISIELRRTKTYKFVHFICCVFFPLQVFA